VKSFDLRSESRKLLAQASDFALEVNRLEPLTLVDDEESESFLMPASMLSSASNEYRLEAHFQNPLARIATENIQKCSSRNCAIGKLSHDIIIGGRSKRNYVESDYGTPFLSGKNIIQIRPTDLKHVSNSETHDLKDMLLDRGWILVTRSGTVGRTCFVWHNFEKYAASEHILRVIPIDEQVDPGYLYAFLASSYGYEQIIRFRFGSVIDEISPNQLKQVIVPLASPEYQKEIGDMIRLAYEKRADALRLEDEAQELLMREIQEHNTNIKDRQHV
jgi:type I restriction enzyme S subunit